MFANVEMLAFMLVESKSEINMFTSVHNNIHPHREGFKKGWKGGFQVYNVL